MNRLICQWIDQLDTLEVSLSNLLGLIFLIQSIFFCFTFDQVKKLFVAFQIYLIPSRWHFSKFSLGSRLMSLITLLFLSFASFNVFSTWFSIWASIFLISIVVTIITPIFIGIKIFVVIRRILFKVNLLRSEMIETNLHGSLSRFKLPFDLLLILVFAENLWELQFSDRLEHLDNFYRIIRPPIYVAAQWST